MGITHLAKRLQQIPSCLGYSWEDVIYTNALMMCSQNAATLKRSSSSRDDNEWNRSKLGNDSNLLIVFYVQIMPDDLVMQLHRFLRTTVTSVPALPDVVSRFRLCRSMRWSVTLADNVQLSFRRDSYSGQPSVIHTTTSKADSRLRRRSSGQSAFTEDAPNRPPYPVIRVKQPADDGMKHRRSPTVRPFQRRQWRHCPVVVCARLPTAARVFKWRKTVLRPTPIMRALARHPTPFMAISMIFCAYRAERRCKWNCSCHVLRQWEQRYADVRQCFAVTHHAFSSGAGRTSDGNGSHASTLKSPSYTKSVSWQHYQQTQWHFFEHVTAHLSELDLIVAYSNSLQSLSVTRVCC